MSHTLRGVWGDSIAYDSTYQALTRLTERMQDYTTENQLSLLILTVKKMQQNSARTMNY